MKVSILGAGNVATHLALALFENNIEIEAVYSRTVQSARALAGRVNARYITHLNDLPQSSSIYFVSVPDEVLEDVVGQVLWEDRLLVHTSGSLSMDVLKPYSKAIGVFYPLQTFSKKKPLVFTSVPCFIEAAQKPDLLLLKGLASKVSQSVYEANSKQRKTLHLAAVFACNFTNYLFSVSEKILKTEHFPFEVLKPLITETVEKSHLLSPVVAQTGPAIRKDYNVMEMHLDYLNEFPEWKEIYELLSNEIMKQHHEKL